MKRLHLVLSGNETDSGSDIDSVLYGPTVGKQRSGLSSCIRETSILGQASLELDIIIPQILAT